MSDNDLDATATLAPETDRETPTNPELSRAPLLPPAPMTLEDSYLDRAIRVVAETGASMARDREERRRQHEEVMAELRDQGSKQDAGLERVASDMAKLALELTANLDLLSGEFKRFRAASEARLAEGDERFNVIERKVAELESKIVSMLEQRVAEALKPIADEFEEIRNLIDEMKKSHVTRPTPAPAT